MQEGPANEEVGKVMSNLERSLFTTFGSRFLFSHYTIATMT